MDTTNMEQQLNTLVSTVCSDLYRSVETLYNCKDVNFLNSLSNEQIHSKIVEIGVQVFNIVERLETVGIRSDISKILLDYRQSVVKQTTQGKIVDKETAAITQTLIEQQETLLYNRCYKCIKQQIEVATELINSLKKILSDRMLNKQLQIHPELV